MRLILKRLGLLMFLCLFFAKTSSAVESLNSHESWEDSYQEAIELFQQEDYQKALDVAQRTLNIQIEKKGENDMDVLRLTNLVGIIQLHLGTDSIAEQSFVRVIAGLEATNATNTRLYAIALENIGSMHLVQDYYDSAEDHLVRALKIFKKVLGEDHVRVAVALNSLGLLYMKWENYEEAEKYLLESRKTFKDSQQNLEGEKSVMFHNLGELYLKLEQYDKAERNAKRALKSQTKMVGKAARRRLATLDLLKRIYQASGHEEEVLEMQNEIDSLRATLPEKSSPYVTDLLIWKIERV